MIIGGNIQISLPKGNSRNPEPGINIPGTTFFYNLNQANSFELPSAIGEVGDRYNARPMILFNERDNDNLEYAFMGTFAFFTADFEAICLLRNEGNSIDAPLFNDDTWSKIEYRRPITIVAGPNVDLTGKEVYIATVTGPEFEAGLLPSSIAVAPALESVQVMGQFVSDRAERVFPSDLDLDDPERTTLTRIRSFDFRNDANKGLLSRTHFTVDGLQYQVTSFNVSRDEKFVTIEGSVEIESA